MTSYDIRSIIKNVLDERDGETVSDEDAFTQGIEAQLAGDVDQIPAYSHGSRPLSLVRFQCMLQDTGYPMEVYTAGDTQSAGGSGVGGLDLKERWVGWGIEIPGQSSWTRSIESSISSLSLAPTPHHPSIQSKYPLAAQQESYLGALIKVYDEAASFRPSSSHTFIGLVSRSVMPGPMEDEADDVIVPSIHVLSVREAKRAAQVDVPKARSEAMAYLASTLKDELAAEYLLLALLGRPAVRPTGLSPLGTLSLNLIDPPPLVEALRDVMPAVVNVPLTIPFLHSSTFIPSAPTSTSLDSGLLQLAPGTLLVVDETDFGDGGKLEEKAVKNLQAVQECLNEQKLQYAYPYMPDLKMECSVKGLVLSKGGRGLVRADISLPVRGTEMPAESPSEEALERIRAYLQQIGSEEQAKKLRIPDKVGDVIQDAFVGMRAAAAGNKEQDAEAALKRRMRIARLLAISHESAELTEDVWNRAVEMDEEAQRRLTERKSVANGTANGHA